MASNLHTFTGNEVIATEVPSYLNQNFTNLNTDKADKSTTYTKSEVDSLVANSGSSEDCLKTTGGVFNGTEVIKEGDSYTSPIIGSVYKTVDDNTSILITASSSVDIVDATTAKLRLEDKTNNYGRAVLEGGIVQVLADGSIMLGAGDSYSNSNSTILMAPETMMISAQDANGLAGLGVVASSPTPLWNSQPMPLTVNGLSPDKFGNIELPISGGGGGDGGYLPTNMATLEEDDWAGDILDDGSNYFVMIYDPATATYPPPKYIQVIGMGVDDIMMIILLSTREGLFDGTGLTCMYQDMIPTQDVGAGMRMGMGIFVLPKATDRPLWISWTKSDDNSLQIIPGALYY